ncbi:MAG: hypothetical protein AAF802_22590 [Planctomycetota bacterium]
MIVCCVFAPLSYGQSVAGQSGELIFNLIDESTGEDVISRVLLYRDGQADRPSSRSRNRTRPMPVRRTVSAGIGVVVDRSVALEIPESSYRFQVIRGPEYRIVSGTFTLEKTSSDEKTVKLPRMVDMQSEGWLSGDACVMPSAASVPLRMASEDLHVCAVLGDRKAKPIPGRDRDEPIRHHPIWIRTDMHSHQGLVYYGLDEIAAEKLETSESSLQGLAAVLKIDRTIQNDSLRVAIENPFAWELPVWLASGNIDGLFLLGDWLRLDRQVFSAEGRNEDAFSLREPTQLGRYAERIYRHALDAGISIAPLAGGGDDSAATPLGYNRIYATKPDGVAFADKDEWWDATWKGQSVVTNGPMLRPRVSGFRPGHTFQARRGEMLQLSPELDLAVRDPVEYLEVIHNNRVHYSARLKEFAVAEGVIPPIEAKESGWVIIRVMTLHKDHYRAAVSAPWWIEFDGKRRVSVDAVEYFRSWLSQYERRLQELPTEEFKPFIPFVKAARSFWSKKAELATP